MTDQLLTPAQAGALLAMTKGALAQLRYLGTGPKFVKLSGRSVRYRHQDLDDWISASIHTSTGPDADHGSHQAAAAGQDAGRQREERSSYQLSLSRR